jgi:hypothetical protein
MNFQNAPETLLRTSKKRPKIKLKCKLANGVIKLSSLPASGNVFAETNLWYFAVLALMPHGTDSIF